MAIQLNVEQSQRVALVVGLGFFMVGLFMLIDYSLFIRSGVQEARGTVVSLERSGKSYMPRISFVSADGQTYVFRSSSSASAGVGDTLAVVYKSAAPEKARIKNDTLVLEWMFMIAGGGLALIRKKLTFPDAVK